MHLLSRIYFSMYIVLICIYIDSFLYILYLCIQSSLNFLIFYLS